MCQTRVGGGCFLFVVGCVAFKIPKVRLCSFSRRVAAQETQGSRNTGAGVLVQQVRRPMRLEACALEGRAGWAESLDSLVPQPVVGSNSGTGAQEPSPTRAAPTRACSRTRPQAAVGASH